MAALLAETSLNIDCFERTNSSLPVIGVGRDIDNITCQLTPVLAAGYAVSTHTVAITYFAAVCLIVLSEAVFETVLPVLAGDQVSLVLVSPDKHLYVFIILAHTKSLTCPALYT